MQTKQIYTLANTIAGEVLGQTDLVQEDLTGVVEMGKAIMDAGALDAYCKALPNLVGKMVFVDRPYYGELVSVLKDNWEFGSIAEKIRTDIGDVKAKENGSWNLVDGQSYDPNVFYQPKVYVKLFNDQTTFEIDCSFTEKQAKQSLQSATQFSAFTSMIMNTYEKALNLRIDALIKRTLANFIGETIVKDYPTGDYGKSSHVRSVNLLKEYNDASGAAKLAAKDALANGDFLRFAAKRMNMTVDRLGTATTLFNINGRTNQTPRDMLHVVLLSDFVRSAENASYSDTFHNEYVKLPKAETVVAWQGTGKDFSFEKVSTIDINTSEGHAVKLSGVLGVMFDHEALGVSLFDKRIKSHYNPAYEFYTNFYKTEARYFNDADENFVVFFIADEVAV